LAIIAAGIQFRDRMGSGAASGDSRQGTEYGDKVGEAVAPLIASGLSSLG
ncbi:MAG: hypothetical protein QOK02_400, partial [Mycobacterium sp.]|nr:hypothetical protein [Mycobacterium sp.]